MAIFAAALGYIVIKDNARRAAEQHIKPLGGFVAWNERGPRWLTRLVGRDLFAIPKEVGFLNEPLEDEDLLLLAGLEDAEQLVIAQNNTFSGRGLRHLTDFQRLRTLYIYDVPITDDGLANLPKIETLRSIQILATRITDDSIALMKEFDYVQEVALGSASLSRQKVEELDRRMPSTVVGWSGQGFHE